MSDALQPASLSPEAITLIKQGTPKPQTETPLIVAVKPREISTPTTLPTPAAELPVKPRAKKEQPAPASPLVSLYVRLPAELSQALLKASSERKMNKTRPFTQQDIIAEALQVWLQKNGNMPEKG